MAAHPRLAAEDRRRQIMQVAMDLFAQKGFDGTTTREIADRAGVNEAIIFRHFPGKEDLYWAIIEDKCRVSDARRRYEEKLHAGWSDHRAFAAIAEQIIRRHTEDTTLTRLLLFSALTNHRLAHRFFRTHIAEYYEILAEHIRERIRRKAFRPVDPLLAARGFLGMVIHYIWVQELFGGKRYQNFDLQRVSETLAGIWIGGMLTRNGGLKGK